MSSGCILGHEDKDKREELAFNQRTIGLALIGVGAFSLLNAIIWFVIRANGDSWDDALVGAEGMVVCSVILACVGGLLLMTRSED